ncbi:MAG: hypothetical protein JW741_10415, partial [Sedimentisphaerales bacterium]|nr:hypothetical protein [Sedimentisphaerales bacterium]
MDNCGDYVIFHRVHDLPGEGAFQEQSQPIEETRLWSFGRVPGRFQDANLSLAGRADHGGRLRLMKLSRLSLEFDLRPGNRGRLYAAASCLSR